MRIRPAVWLRSGYTASMQLIAALVLTLAISASAQFEILDGKTTASLRGIDAVSPRVAWASGSGGTVLLTTDGGANWKHCAVPLGGEKLDFRGVQGFDAVTAVILSSGKGDLSRLYKTTDACLSWTLLFINPDKTGFWDAIWFRNRDVGYLLGDPVHNSFYFAESTNGGRTWTQQRNRGLRADASSQGVFAASNSSLTFAGRPSVPIFGSGGKAGALAYLEKSVVICLDDCPASEMNADGNKNEWVRKPVPVGDKSEASGVFALSSRNVTHTAPTAPPILGWANDAILAVGGDYLKPEDPTGTAAFTLDGGKTWYPALTPPHGYRSAVTYDAATNTWIAVGPNGVDISKDDGKNWLPLTPSAADTSDADKNWNAISLPFVVGAKGKIGKLEAR